MGKWNYRLNSGLALREEIDNTDYINEFSATKILKKILDCYKEFKSKLNKNDDDYEDCLYSIEGNMMSIEDDIEYFDAEDSNGELEEEDISDTVDNHLADFYDLCDLYRCWVEI